MQSLKAQVKSLCVGAAGSEFGKSSVDSLEFELDGICLLYTSPSPRDRQKSRMPSSA